MTWKGSVVLKRRHLLNIKANLEFMWRSNLSDLSRSDVMGQLGLLDRIVQGGESYYRWDDVIQYQVWDGGYCTCPPAKTFKWLFDPTPLPYEEQMKIYKLLNMWAAIDLLERSLD